MKTSRYNRSSKRTLYGVLVVVIATITVYAATCERRWVATDYEFSRTNDCELWGTCWRSVQCTVIECFGSSVAFDCIPNNVMVWTTLAFQETDCEEDSCNESGWATYNVVPLQIWDRAEVPGCESES